jgi:hypothetical protein
VLCCAVLCCAVLCCAVLCCAVLCCAVLCCAVFIWFISLFCGCRPASILNHEYNCYTNRAVYEKKT